MTEFEFAKLLGELPEGYIQQAQAFRNGSYRAMHTGSKRKRTLGFLAAAILAIAMLGGFFWTLNFQNGEKTVQQSAVDSWQERILRGEERFWSEDDRQLLTLEEYTGQLRQGQTDDQCAPWAYAELDMDRDGSNELVIRFRSGDTDSLTLLLWVEKGRVNGARFTATEMHFLKEDGTFYCAKRNHWGWCRLKRQENTWVPVIRIPQDEYSSLKDAPWRTISDGEALPKQSRMSSRSLGLSGKSGISGFIVGALTEKADYSLYVPITGWRYEQISPYGTVQSADSWYCEEMPEARLTIFKTDSDSTALQKPDYVLRTGTMYTLEMRRDTAERSCILQAYVRLGETTNYVMELEYPDDFWDKDILRSMLGSVQFTHSISANREPEWWIGQDDAMVEVILYVNEGYSLYIPKDWYLGRKLSPIAETIGQYGAGSWYGTDRQSLSVVDLGQISAEDAENWAIQSLKFSSVERLEDGSLLGTSDDRQIGVSFRQGSGGRMYAVIRRCPVEKIANSWQLLNTLAESLMVSSEG